MPIHMRMRKLRGPHMKKSMPFEPFRTHTQAVNVSSLEDRFEAGTEVTLELLRSQRPGHPQGDSGQDPRQGRADEGAERPGQRLQRRRPRSASRPPAAPARSSSSPSGPTGPSSRIGHSARNAPTAPSEHGHARHDPQRLPGRRYPEEDRLHGRDAADLPLRVPRAGPGRQPVGRQQHPEGVRRLEHPRPAEPVLRRRPLETGDLRAGDHALHHLLDHPAAAAGGGALAGEALQGRRGRPGRGSPSTPAT